MDHAYSFQEHLMISELDIAGSKSFFPKEKCEPFIVTMDLVFNFTVNVHSPC